MKYNYVVFDSTTEYFVVALSDLAGKENVQLLRYCMDGSANILRFFYKVHTTRHINNIVELPLKAVWNPLIFKHNFAEDRPLCLIFNTSYINLRKQRYFEYLKKVYPDCKLVFTIRDTVEWAMNKFPDFDVDYLYKTFNLILTNNIIDAEHYGFEHFNSYGSKVDVKRDPNYPISDVVFIGAAKDRLESVYSAYHRLTDSGLKCDFYVSGVPEKQRTVDGIKYAGVDAWMPYHEMLYRSVNSRCIFEATKKGTTAFTSRFFEAIMYNKRLLTDNPLVKSTRFFDDRYIGCYEDFNKFDFTQVFSSHDDPDYGYNNEYSPLRMLDLIESKLSVDAAENTRNENME